MTQQERTDAVFVGVFLGFLLFFGLIEQQKQQTARLREMRKRLGAENGRETDLENLKADWQHIRGDLRSASQKVLQNVQ